MVTAERLQFEKKCVYLQTEIDVCGGAMHKHLQGFETEISPNDHREDLSSMPLASLCGGRIKLAKSCEFL